MRVEKLEALKVFTAIQFGLISCFFLELLDHILITFTKRLCVFICDIFYILKNSSRRCGPPRADLRQAGAKTTEHLPSKNV